MDERSEGNTHAGEPPQPTFRLASSLAIEVQPTALQFLPMVLKSTNRKERSNACERRHGEAAIHNFSNNRTITSLRSLVCRWCSGSRKFCLMLSSSEYFTSAICFMASPISMRAWAARIDKNGLGDKVALRQYDLSILDMSLFF